MATKKAKTTTKTEDEALKKQAQARLAAINEFNRNNMGEAWIDPERVPTEEEVEAAKKEFEDRTIALRDKNDYLVADKDNALRVAKFIRKFVANGFWTQRYWVGVVNFVDYIDTFIKECEAESKDLVMEYGPLQFCYLMFENYAGFGYDAAKKMAELWDEYVPIHDVLRDHIEYYNSEAKACEKLKQRWGMLAQGYYLVFLDEVEEQQTTAEPATETATEVKAEVTTETTENKAE